MKNYIIAFFAVMALSCWMNDFGVEPHVILGGIKGVLTPGYP